MRRIPVEPHGPLAGGRASPTAATLLAACGALLLVGCGGPEGDAWIKSAGWTDEADPDIQGSLVIDNQVLAYSAYGLINHGTLTEDGQAREQVVAEGLLGEELGTSWCDDIGCEGGIEATITVVRDGNADTIIYPRGSPPPQLQLADELVTDIMDSLTKCLETTEIVPDEGCLRMAGF